MQRRGALRLASAHRTVSVPAVMVIAGVIPINLLAKERRAVDLGKAEVGKKMASTKAGFAPVKGGKELRTK